MVSIEDEFRAVEIMCPACSFAFGYDPWKEPLSVPGVRLAPLRRATKPESAPDSGISRRKLGRAWAITLAAGGLTAAGILAAMAR
jgi:hypothetical protein